MKRKYRWNPEKVDASILIIAILVAIGIFFGVREMHYNCVDHFNYTVEEGDTITSILSHYYSSEKDMSEIFKDTYGFPTLGDTIYEGQMVSLPLYKWNSCTTTGTVKAVCGSEVVVVTADGNQYGYYNDDPDSIELGDIMNLTFINGNTLVKAWK